MLSAEILNLCLENTTEARKEMFHQHSYTRPLTFDDVTAYFSEEEWKLLHEWQKELYRNVMKEIHQALILLGPRIAASVFTLKAKENDGLHSMYHGDFVRQSTTNDSAGTAGSQEQLTFRSVANSLPVDVHTNKSVLNHDIPICENEVKMEAAAEEDDAVIIFSVKAEKNTCITNHQDFEKGDTDSCAVGTADSQEQLTFRSAANSLPVDVHTNKSVLNHDIPICENEVKVEAATEEDAESMRIQHKSADSKRSVANCTKYKSSIRNPHEDVPWNSDIYVRNQEHVENDLELTDTTASHHGTISNTSAQLIFHPYNRGIKGSNKSYEFENNLENSEISTAMASLEQQYRPYRHKESEKRVSLKGKKISQMVKKEELYQCTKCEKNFSQRRSLSRHYKIHEEQRERPYKCVECQKAFSEKCNLVIHKRTHTGEKPYQCSECKKRFSVKSHLISHQRIHSGEKPYQCTICEKSFSWRSQLIAHTPKHT